MRVILFCVKIFKKSVYIIDLEFILHFKVISKNNVHKIKTACTDPINELDEYLSNIF